MKAQKLFLLLITIIIFPGISFSQDDDNTFKNGRPNLENTLQTDGYGLNGSNSYLGGLGTVNDYVRVDHDPVFNQSADGSIEAWIYITDISEINYILAKGSQLGTSAYAFYIATNGRPAIRFGNVNMVSNGPAVPLNSWTHVVVTWDDLGNINTDFYIDGNKAGTTIIAAGNINNIDHEIRIGTAEYGNEGFSGYIDEVRFWGIPLTQGRIRTNRFVGLGETPASNFDGTNFQGSVNYEGLIASWTFNAGLSTFVWEYIGGHYGIRQGNSSINSAVYGYPLPYNNALYFPGTGGDDNFIELRDSAGFTNEVSDSGTVEMWVKLDGGVPGQDIDFISKGATDITNSFSLGLAPTGRIAFKIAQVTGTSQGAVVPLYSWFHIAAAWRKSGASFIVNLYINGELDYTLNLPINAMPVNSEPFRIGKADGFIESHSPENAYIDEIRIWRTVQTSDNLKKFMFSSEGAIGQLFSNDLLAVWSFDGDLMPTGRFNRMRGTFDVGTTNRCRFSSYYGEHVYSGSILNLPVTPNITVLNSNDPVEHAYPMGFYQTVLFDTIPFGNPNGMNSTINIGPSFPDNNVHSVELFLSAQAHDLEDFEITLTAPNGQTRTVIDNIAGNSDNILTIFTDDADLNVTDPGFIAPWSVEAKPMQAFGTFNNSPARGNWTLNIKQLSLMSSMGNGPSIVNGWGIRLNDQTITGIQNTSTEVPQRYELSQNYPNPFNPSTSIKFSIPKSGLVSLIVYDILGKEVATLVNKDLNSGSYEYTFDAAGFTSGVYFYRLEAGDFSEVKKMLLIK